MNRRDLLKSFIALGAATAVPSWASLGSPRVLGAVKTTDETFAVIGLDQMGQILFQSPLPLRGHSFAAHPKQAIAIAFARRPGSLAIVVDLVSAKEITRLDLGEEGYFYGHGVFTPDARYLLTTENNLSTSEGRIGIWDVNNGFSRLEEKTTGGIGPHELIALSDGGYAVANGGILTDPTSERKKLNLSTMDPSLVIMDKTLQIINQIRPPEELHQLSIRHLAEAGITGGKEIGIGMQWEGDPMLSQPVIGIYNGQELKLIDESSELSRNYIGSVAAGPDTIFFTAPKSGKLIKYHPANGLLESIEAPDIYGIASAGDLTYATAKNEVLIYPTNGEPERIATDFDWDNHLISLESTNPALASP